MLRSRPPALLFVLLLAGALVTGTAAQSDGPPPVTPPAANGQTVSVGAFDVDIDPSQPVLVCAVERQQGFDAATAAVVVVAVTPDGAFAVPPFRVPATGPLASAAPGECRGLDPEPIQ